RGEAAGSVLALPLGEGAQIHNGHGDAQRGRDDLDRSSLEGRERGAEDLVARRDLVQALLQGGHTQRTRQTLRDRNIVRRAAGLDLVEKPQALLREGGREDADL